MNTWVLVVVLANGAVGEPRGFPTEVHCWEFVESIAAGARRDRAKLHCRPESLAKGLTVGTPQPGLDTTLPSQTSVWIRGALGTGLTR